MIHATCNMQHEVCQMKMLRKQTLINFDKVYTRCFDLFITIFVIVTFRTLSRAMPWPAPALAQSCDGLG